MAESYTMMLSLTLYKVVTILAGLAFAFMGYKLFVHGIFTEAGELRTNWDNKSLVLKKATPGTFFALFGTVIVCVSLWRGLSFAPAQEQGSLGGSGMFSITTSKAEDRSWQNPNVEKTRQTVLGDVALLNQFENALVLLSQQENDSCLTVTAAENDLLLDLIDRTKATLILSVWSQEWGDQAEFRKWAQYDSGYSYGDPPTAISQAAEIFKGGAK